MRATGVQYCGDCVIRGVGYIYPVLEMSERSVVPKRVVLRSRGEDSLSKYGQGVRVYGSSRDLCTNLVLRLRGSGLSVFGATENTGRTGWDCKLLSGLSN